MFIEKKLARRTRTRNSFEAVIINMVCMRSNSERLTIQELGRFEPDQEYRAREYVSPQMVNY